MFFRFLYYFCHSRPKTNGLLFLLLAFRSPFLGPLCPHGTESCAQDTQATQATRSPQAS